MGDIIQKLPVDETLKLSVKDKNVIKTFFGVEDLPAVNTSNDDGTVCI